MHNTDRLRLWADELESTDLPQGRQALMVLDDNGNPIAACCLGIAVEVARLHGVYVGVSKAVFPESQGRPRRVCRTYDSLMGVLPLNVAAWYGVDTDPLLFSSHGDHNATVWNDIEGATFSEIASMIRHTYLEGS